jgi:hypothetical protein
MMWELPTELYRAGLKGVVGTVDKIIPKKCKEFVGIRGQNYTVLGKRLIWELPS